MTAVRLAVRFVNFNELLCLCSSVLVVGSCPYIAHQSAQHELSSTQGAEAGGNNDVDVVTLVLQVVELASTAYENTTAPEIKAESCYLKARVHHAMGSLGEAKLLYTEACHLWPQFPLAQYGMAQMLVYEGNVESAIKALDAVLAEVPDNQVLFNDEHVVTLINVMHGSSAQAAKY